MTCAPRATIHANYNDTARQKIGQEAMAWIVLDKALYLCLWSCKMSPFLGGRLQTSNPSLLGGGVAFLIGVE